MNIDMAALHAIVVERGISFDDLLEDVKAAVLSGIDRSVKAGMPVGLLTGDVGFAAECVAAGAAYVAIGVDVGLLTRGAESLLANFRARVGASAS